MKSNNSKVKENGITLVSLVITIIILLILANVTIGLTIGENGIFTKAKQAKENFLLAANIEEESLRNAEIELENGNTTGGDNTNNNVKKIRKISANPNTSFSMSIDSEGNLWTWGPNNYGQLGNGTQANKGMPIPIPIMQDIKFKEIATGYDHCIAIDNEGYLWAWGMNGYGQFGNGTTTRSYTPIKVIENMKFTQIAAGKYFSMAIDSEGNLWTFGFNNIGQLGNGATTNSSTPIKIKEGIVQIAAGENHCMAIDNEGYLWAWGSNGWGQLGNGTTTSSATPIKIKEGIIQIAVGSTHSMAIDRKGKLWTWGHNISGQLGNGTTTNSSTPIEIKEGITQISGGQYFSMAIDSEENLWSWGRNDCGQLGSGTTTNSSTPIKIKEGIIQIGSGVQHSMAIDEKDNLWTWGSNSGGGLGNGEVGNVVSEGCIIYNEPQKIEVRTASYDDILKPGDYVKYDTGKTNVGEQGVITCRVLYNKESKYGLQIISNTNLGTVALGGTTWETAKNSYNSAPNTLNTSAESYINPDYATDARCVGTIPIVEEGKFTYKNIDTNLLRGFYSGWTVPTTLKNERNTGLKIGFSTSYADINTMYAIQDESIYSTGANYWIFSRSTGQGSYNNVQTEGFNIDIINKDGVRLWDFENSIVRINKNGGLWFGKRTNGLRPCFAIKPDVKVLSGDGKTPETAYELGI